MTATRSRRDEAGMAGFGRPIVHTSDKHNQSRRIAMKSSLFSPVQRVFQTLALAFSAGIFASPLFSQTTTSPLYAFRHLAGAPGGAGSTDAVGTAARFNQARGVVSDSAGNIYVTDSSNNTLRKIAPDGTVTTVAGTPASNGADPAVGTIDGTGSAAYFWAPMGPSIDTTGNVFLSDLNGSKVRKVTSSGVVTTVAGTPPLTAFSNPPAIDAGSFARFQPLRSTAVDSAGNIFVAEPYSQSLQKIAPNGSVTTLSLNYPADWPGGGPFGTDPRGASPEALARNYQIAVDHAGNLYFSHFLYVPPASGTSYYLIARADPLGNVSVLTGYPPITDLIGLTVDASDRLFVGTQDGIVVRDLTGTIKTLAGTAGIDGDGLTVTPTGNIVVSDFDQILKIGPTGGVGLLAGLAAVPGSADGTGSTAQFNSPQSVAVDGSGNVYVADSGNNTIRKITAGGVVTTLAGLAGSSGSANGTGAAARFELDGASIAVDTAGTVYVTEPKGARIRKITSAGVVTTLTGTFPTVYASGLAVDTAGNLFYASDEYVLRKLTPDGTVSDLSRFSVISGLAVDRTGNVFVSDSPDHAIFKVTPTGDRLPVAGGWGTMDGPVATVGVGDPIAIAVDPAGNLFFLGESTSWVREITVQGNVVTLGGLRSYRASEDGLGAAAHFNRPMGIAVDAAGKIYIADTGNHAIRVGEVAGPPVITSQPQNASVAATSNAQFTVRASSALPLTYQWTYNGSPIAGATSATLTLSSVNEGNAGNYAVVVSNQVGNATSDASKLTVTASTAATPDASGGSGGGGTTEAWFVLLLLAAGWVQRGKSKATYGRTPAN